MTDFYKKYNNGLQLIMKKTEGLLSVSAGILVKTGSANETESENGISHFIEHMLFKGTSKRSAFEISDYVDTIGAQINAFTSKELTCYYIKATAEHLEHSLEVLSDLFFHSQFDEGESQKEKGVVIEEIGMCEDTPEDLCLDILAQSYYGESGLGRTILGSVKNVKKFTKRDIEAYMRKYYTPDNVVVSIVGNVDYDWGERLAEKYFAGEFTDSRRAAPQAVTKKTFTDSLYKTKRIEQAHIGISMKGLAVGDKRSEALNIVNAVFGGGMSSRLFQKVREELGLAYTVYSYPSQYKDNGVTEIYAGVNPEFRDTALEAIVGEIKKLKTDRITEKEFLRGKEQIKSAFVLGQESTASQMLLYGKHLLFLDSRFEFENKIRRIESVTMAEINEVIDGCFDISTAAYATVGRKRTPLQV